MLFLLIPGPLSRGGFDCGSWGKRIASVIMVILVGVLYTDLQSGVQHINLDNESLLTWPVIRPMALGFQGHHLYPVGVQQFPLFPQLGEFIWLITLVVATLSAFILVVVAM